MPSVLLSFATVALLASPSGWSRSALAALAGALAAWSLALSNGLMRGAAIGLVFATCSASLLVLLAGARPSWVRPLALVTFALGTLSLLGERLS